MSPETRSAVMARIQAKNTSPERLVFAGLRSLGFSFTRHAKDLPGRPDVVFRSLRIAVFIDGDFWHGWRFSLWRHKLSPKWHDKIQTNRARDRRNHRALRALGWTVIRIWEHQVEQSLPRCLACIERVVVERRESQVPDRSALAAKRSNGTVGAPRVRVRTDRSDGRRRRA
jgi:DNA mismatch endonuclease (patch repair protein)